MFQNLQTKIEIRHLNDCWVWPYCSTLSSNKNWRIVIRSLGLLINKKRELHMQTHTHQLHQHRGYQKSILTEHHRKQKNRLMPPSSTMYQLLLSNIVELVSLYSNVLFLDYFWNCRMYWRKISNQFTVWKRIHFFSFRLRLRRRSFTTLLIKSIEVVTGLQSTMLNYN